MSDSNSTTEAADRWNRAAMDSLKQGKLAEAVEQLGQVIALEPDEALHYNNRGRILFTLDRHQEALADYTKAIELAPSAALYSSRSVVYLALGRTAATLADLNEAYDLDPSADNLLNRATFFANMGLAADGLSDMNKVVEMQPENPRHRLARANLALALAPHQPNFYKTALADIEKALELDPTEELRPKLIQLAGLIRGTGKYRTED